MSGKLSLSVFKCSEGFFEPYVRHGKSPLFSRGAHMSPMDLDQRGLTFECVDVGGFHE